MAQLATPAQRQRIGELRQAGWSNSEIGKELGLRTENVSRNMPEHLKKNVGRRRSQTLELPGLSGRDPEERVAISMDHEQFVQLSGTNSEALLVAAGIAQESLRTRLLRTICETGPYSDVPSLMNAVRNGPKDQRFGAHEVTHLLYSLSKAGAIQFKASGRTNRSLLQDIRATDAGYTQATIPVPGKQQHNVHGARVPGTSRAGHAVGKDMTEQRHHHRTAQGGPITVTRTKPSPLPQRQLVRAIDVYEQAALEDPGQPETPVPPTRATDEPYPMLGTLRASFAVRAEADAKAMRFAEAAAMLEKDDPAESQRLLEKALTFAPPALTELEREYLLYADKYPAKV